MGSNLKCGGGDMEINEIIKKVNLYLAMEVGHMVSPSSPIFNVEEKHWIIPIKCKTKRGTFVIGEFWVDEDGNFKMIPTKEEMLRVIEIQKQKTPYLIYATQEEINKSGLQAIKVG